MSIKNNEGLIKAFAKPHIYQIIRKLYRQLKPMSSGLLWWYLFGRPPLYITECGKMSDEDMQILLKYSEKVRSLEDRVREMDEYNRKTGFVHAYEKRARLRSQTISLVRYGQKYFYFPFRL